MLTIRTYGAEGVTTQIDRINLALERLGHRVITSEEDRVDEIDFVYSNDLGSSWEALGFAKERGCPIIANILDIPEHLGPVASDQARKISCLNSEVNALTCISEFVRGQLKRFCGIKGTEVIYQPIKNVRLDPRDGPREMKYLIVGRNRDPNKKHAEVTLPVIHELEGNFDSLYVVGESVGVGNHLGYVSDEDLNEIYNNSRYLFFPSKIEGLGLPPIEAAICGCTPILRTWNLAAKEFFRASSLFESNREIVDFIKRGGHPYTWVNSTPCLPENVAKRIVEVFERKCQ